MVHALVYYHDSLFAGTYYGNIYAMPPESQTWTPLYKMPGSYMVNSFSVTNDRLFACTNSGTRRAPEWSTAVFYAANSLLSTVHDVCQIDSVVLATNYGRGIARSTDSGASFVLCDSGLTTGFIKGIIEHDSALYVWTQDKGVFRSIDYGESWDSLNAGLSRHDVGDMISHRGILHAATWGGVFAYDTSILSWTPVGNWSAHPEYVNEYPAALVSGADSALYLAMDYRKIYRMNKGDGKWFSVGDSLGQVRFSGMAVRDSFLYVSTTQNSIWVRKFSEMTDRIPSSVMQSRAFTPSPSPSSPAISFTIRTKADHFLATITAPYPLPVSLRVYSLAGRLVARTDRIMIAAGATTLPIKMTNTGKGYYLWRLDAGPYSVSRLSH
jgi:hypothetical protein